MKIDVRCWKCENKFSVDVEELSNGKFKCPLCGSITNLGTGAKREKDDHGRKTLLD